MTLTTHALVGAASAQIFSFNPIAAAIAAFLSHFLIDAIPHWDYQILSAQKDPATNRNHDMALGPAFYKDITRIGFDALLGMALSGFFAFYFFGSPTIFLSLLGGVFGILPDPLQFAYFKIKREPLVSLQKFHEWIHSGNRVLKDKNRWAIGLFSQILLVIGFWGLTILNF